VGPTNVTWTAADGTACNSVGQSLPAGILETNPTTSPTQKPSTMEVSILHAMLPHVLPTNMNIKKG
jgi:hypothetical protein